MNLNKIITESVEVFFNNLNSVVEIEGTSEKTWNLPGFSISLTEEPMKYFVVLVSNKQKYDYLLHFENETDDGEPYTEKEKDILFSALANSLKSGDIITTEGGVTPGGISALKKLENYGFKIIGKHDGKSVYWASDRILNSEKLDKWLKEPEHRKDFKILDINKPIFKNNVLPIVPVLQKI